MTSGLFNTGGTGDSAEITRPLTVQPLTSKFVGQELLDESFEPDLDMNMFEDLGAGFADPLGDASLDSFTDLSALLSENTFLDQKTVAPVTFLFDLDAEEKPDQRGMKRSFAEVEDTSDLGRLSANVGLVKSSSHDHDYSAKRQRTSAVTEDTSVEDMEEVFLVPAPSTSDTTQFPTEDKYRHRREKNNVASKRSREIRKRKFTDMEGEAERLIVDNARLEKRVVDLERLAKQMKEILVAKMAGK
ncbi:transcription factor zip-2-like [Littorina saxatilis]|uniref:BZIP domain-containing protein n=1 Tax=Littorina saxatilis TaxID=31220 RepID=A0AAN9G247_9CAEN